MSRAMKDSGIPWIGEIPEEWECANFKYLHNKSNVGESIDKNFHTDDINNSIIFYTAGVKPLRVIYNDFPEWKYTQNEDLLLSRNGTPYVYLPINHSAYSDHIIRVDIIEDKYCKRYVRYCLQRAISYVVVDSVSLATWSITLWDKQKIPLPPLSEQQRIAEFLDRKCGEIDETIALQEEFIEELKAYKQSVITEAVTRGLNPNVKFKDSGVDWIGKIPQGWNVRRIKTIGSAKNGLTYSPSDMSSEEDGILVLRSSNIQNGKLCFDDNVFVSTEIPTELMVHKGDLIICSRNGSAALVGKCAMVEDDDLVATYGAFMMRFQSQYIKRYIYYLLSSAITQYKPLFTTTTINQLTVGIFGSLAVPFSSSKTEQKQIADYLDNKCTEIDSLIAIKQQKIEELKDYKKSVIYEYVTGKKEVNG